MTPEELKTLRHEAKDFLCAVQQLGSFGERRAKLQPPPVAFSLRWKTIIRLLSWPRGDSPPPGTGVLLWEEVGETRPSLDEPEELEAYLKRRLAGERERPGKDDLEQLESYAKRLQTLADSYLAGAQWGARAVHDALRSGAEILLPRPAPEVPIHVGWLRASELHILAARHRPQPELRGSRDSTWKAAVASVEARLRGRRATRRDALARARTYLDAAVNRKFRSDPVEPTDDPRYELRARARMNRLEKRKEIEDNET